MGYGIGGSFLIKKERYRLVADCELHADGSMVRAAQCYAEAARRQTLGGDAEDVAGVVAYWPWEPVLFEIDADRVRNLAKAGALIAAEIDRLQRAEAKKGAA